MSNVGRIERLYDSRTKDANAGASVVFGAAVTEAVLRNRLLGYFIVSRRRTIELSFESHRWVSASSVRIRLLNVLTCSAFRIIEVT